MFDDFNNSSDETILIKSNFAFDPVKFDRTFSKVQQAPMVPKNIHVDWISPNARKFNQHAR